MTFAMLYYSISYNVPQNFKTSSFKSCCGCFTEGMAKSELIVEAFPRDVRKWVAFFLALRSAMSDCYFEAADKVPYNMQIIFIIGFFSEKELWLPEGISGKPQDLSKLTLEAFKKISGGFLITDEHAFQRALETAAMKDVAIHRMLQSRTKLAIYMSLEGHPLFPKFKRLQAKLDGYDDQYCGSRAIADLMTVIREHLDGVYVDLNTSGLKLIKQLSKTRDITSEMLDAGLNQLKAIVQLLKWLNPNSRAEEDFVENFCDNLKTHADHRVKSVATKNNPKRQIGRAHV